MVGPRITRGVSARLGALAGRASQTDFQTRTPSPASLSSRAWRRPSPGGRRAQAGPGGALVGSGVPSLGRTSPGGKSRRGEGAGVETRFREVSGSRRAKEEVLRVETGVSWRGEG